MNLKQEINMFLDHGHTNTGSYILGENYMGVSNLIYHKFLSEGSSQMEKFLSHVIGTENKFEGFRNEMYPKIMEEKEFIGSMDSFGAYERVGTRDRVGVKYGTNTVTIELALYKLIRKMLNDTDLSPDEINVSVYRSPTEFHYIVICHNEEPIIFTSAYTTPTQGSLFDE